MRPHRQQPTRPRRPWDSPGKNTGVGCHFLLQCIKVKSESEGAQSCLTLSYPMDCSLPGSPIHGIFQARVLEWGAIAFSQQRMPSRVKRRYRYLVIWGSLTNNTWSIKVNKVPPLTPTSILHDPVLQLSFLDSLPSLCGRFKKQHPNFKACIYRTCRGGNSAKFSSFPASSLGTCLVFFALQLAKYPRHLTTNEKGNSL